MDRMWLQGGDLTPVYELVRHEGLKGLGHVLADICEAALVASSRFAWCIQHVRRRWSP